MFSAAVALGVWLAHVIGHHASPCVASGVLVGLCGGG